MVLSVVLGISYSYAEIATVEVPFESNGLTCSYNDDLIEYHCIWQGSKQKPVTLEELEEFKDVLTEEQYEEALEDITPPEPVVVKEDPPTYEERVIERIEERIEKGEETRADKDLLEALKNLNECRRGLGNSAPVQTEGAWESPILKPDTYGESFDYSKNYLLGKVVKAYEECVAQFKLEAKVLGNQYGNMVVHGDFQPYHADMRTTDYNYPYVPEQHNMQPALCKALQHHGNAQYDYGCLVKPSGQYNVITYTNPIYEAYAKYVNGDDSEQLRKNIQKALDENSKVYRNYGGQN